MCNPQGVSIGDQFILKWGMLINYFQQLGFLGQSLGGGHVLVLFLLSIDLHILLEWILL